MIVKVKKLTEEAILPTYATDGSGCFDIYSVSRDSFILSGFQAIFDTGLSFEIPEGYVMLIFSRSGMGFKYQTRLSNCVGVIDSDYRGELKIALHRDIEYDGFPNKFDGLRKELPIDKGTRIAQGMIIPIPKVQFELVEELSTTERGEGGFGSTGTK